MLHKIKTKTVLLTMFVYMTIFGFTPNKAYAQIARIANTIARNSFSKTSTSTPIVVNIINSVSKNEQLQRKAILSQGTYRATSKLPKNTLDKDSLAFSFDTPLKNSIRTLRKSEIMRATQRFPKNMNVNKTTDMDALPQPIKHK